MEIAHIVSVRLFRHLKGDYLHLPVATCSTLIQAIIDVERKEGWNLGAATVQPTGWGVRCASNNRLSRFIMV